jgi:hypothetical protein
VQGLEDPLAELSAEAVAGDGFDEQTRDDVVGVGVREC